jgi:P-type Ca2+ transporter type 2C
LISALTIFLAAAFAPLQRLLDTVDLTLEQWAICVGAAATIIVVEEVRKFIRRRGNSVSETVPVATPATAPAAS